VPRRPRGFRRLRSAGMAGTEAAPLPPGPRRRRLLGGLRPPSREPAARARGSEPPGPPGPAESGPGGRGPGKSAQAEHRITLLARPGCHLCDDARAVIARVAAEVGASWEERDITQSAGDMREYWDKIPVTFVDGVQHDFWRVSEDRLRAALRS